jgi:hypothetical protein
MLSPVMRLRLLAVAACALLAMPATVAAKPISRSRWLSGYTVTEYYPIPEAWFVGRKVEAPGLPGKHRVDWLYSAMGVSMQGTGIGLDGRYYHIDALGQGGWVTETARPSVPGPSGWAGGPPYWRAGGYWLSSAHRVTFPLDAGGWSKDAGRRYVPLPGVSFAPGQGGSDLEFYKSIAVDPRVIPLGSLVYVAAYRNTAGHGWFRAEDTGGAIIDRHVDVYRSPPAQPGWGDGTREDQRIYVIPPGRSRGGDAPPAARSEQPSPASPSGGAGAP